MNNARDDRLRASNFWKASFEKRRCLVPATSFCEPKGKKPATYFWFGLAGDEDRPPFAFAGVWRYFKGAYGKEERAMVTSSIVTTAPNELVRDVHPDRMPAILAPADYETWLTGEPDEAFDLIRPFQADRMVVHQSGLDLTSDHGAS